jgi:hypothetical protein
MVTKEEYYQLVLKLRAILSDPANLVCTCPKRKCEWHGKCLECVALHRYNKDHLPSCFQVFMNDKLKAIAAFGELDATEKEKTPPEYWDYVREQDRLSGNSHGRT